MKTNLAAIIMPAKNAAGTIKKSLDGIVNQHRGGWDVFVVDDNSTDETKSIVESYGKRSGIHYLLSEGTGPAAARNTALAHIEKLDVHGMIAFCDSDDVWEPQHLGDCWKFLRANPGFGMVYREPKFVFEDGSPAKPYGIPSPDVFSREELLKQNFVFISTVVCESSAVRGLRFNEDLVPLEDWAFWLEVTAGTKACRLTTGEFVTYLVKEKTYHNDADNAAARSKVLDLFAAAKPKTIKSLVINEIDVVSVLHKRFASIDGWLSDDEGAKLYSEADGKRVIEIGSYKGRSANYIASSAAHLSCVDTFSAGSDGQAQNGNTLDEFLRNTKQYNNITVFQGTSVSQKDKFEDGSVDMVFVDAMHDEKSVSTDIESYWNKIKPGGKMLFHDYAWYGHGVMSAVDKRFGGPSELVDSLAIVNKLQPMSVSKEVFAGKSIVISPFSKRLINGAKSPKDFPAWHDFVGKIKSYGATVIQVGMSDEESIGADKRLSNLATDGLLDVLKGCDLWISVDSFVQHFAWFHGIYGIVLFSQSDPFIFGHKENLNVLKHRKYLRKNQFASWSEATAWPESFVSVDELIKWTSLRLLKPDLSGSVYSLT